MNDFLDSVRHLIALMRDVLDAMSGDPSIDERIMAATKHRLNSIKAMQDLMIEVRHPMGHDSSLEAENSIIERDHRRIVTANRYFETATRRSYTRALDLECASKAKDS